MKLNNKGFAITSIIYSMLILFLTLVVLIIGNLASRKAVFDKQKEEILDKVENFALFPEEYQRVEYIKSTGSQYIDLDFKANQDTKIVIDSNVITTEGVTPSIFGGSPGYFNFTTISYHPGGYFWWNGYESGYKGEKDEAFERTIITIDKNKCYRNQELVGEFTYTEWEDTNNIYLFGRNNNGVLDDSGEAIIYSCRLYDNGKLIRNLIPCYHKESGIIGLYDLVNATFYINSGTGTFVIGDDV